MLALEGRDFEAAVPLYVRLGTRVPETSPCGFDIVRHDAIDAPTGGAPFLAHFRAIRAYDTADAIIRAKEAVRRALYTLAYYENIATEFSLGHEGFARLPSGQWRGYMSRRTKPFLSRFGESKKFLEAAHALERDPRPLAHRVRKAIDVYAAGLAADDDEQRFQNFWTVVELLSRTRTTTAGDFATYYIWMTGGEGIEKLRGPPRAVRLAELRDRRAQVEGEMKEVERLRNDGVIHRTDTIEIEDALLGPATHKLEQFARAGIEHCRYALAASDQIGGVADVHRALDDWFLKKLGGKLTG